ncbi:hypothetical protein Desti_5162 [Desulfomonile tiedjei DSM 6799]|uniref:Uncharacterized protein n=1 Tax=Desulfomonile tiedjei (strain ATCC 49306 / DSM 6799 / DCB-1) TaxID=706587 RepID=I4CDX4_DESTA|nr:hypothetical protein Desti_5162 [Desulfomonile tiedjei DSM 6799]
MHMLVGMRFFRRVTMSVRVTFVFVAVLAMFCFNIQVFDDWHIKSLFHNGFGEIISFGDPRVRIETPSQCNLNSE